MTYDLTWQPYRDAVANGLTVVRRRVTRSPHDPDQSVLFYEAWLPDLPMPAATAWFLPHQPGGSLSLLYIHVNDNLRLCRLASMLCVAAAGHCDLTTGSVNELSRAWCFATGWKYQTASGWKITSEALAEVSRKLPPFTRVAAAA